MDVYLCFPFCFMTLLASFIHGHGCFILMAEFLAHYLSSSAIKFLDIAFNSMFLIYAE